MLARSWIYLPHFLIFVPLFEIYLPLFKIFVPLFEIYLPISLFPPSNEIEGANPAVSFMV
jgi:hypothetical protein